MHNHMRFVFHLFSSKISRIDEYAFAFCDDLQVIEINEIFQFQTINETVFEKSKDLIIMVPAKIKI